MMGGSFGSGGYRFDGDAPQDFEDDFAGTDYDGNYNDFDEKNSAPVASGARGQRSAGGSYYGDGFNDDFNDFNDDFSDDFGGGYDDGYNGNYSDGMSDDFDDGYDDYQSRGRDSYDDDFDDDFGDGYDDRNSRGRGGYDDGFDDDFGDGYDSRNARGRGGYDDGFDDDFGGGYNGYDSRNSRGRGGYNGNDGYSNVNYDDFEDRGYYNDDSQRGRSASRNVIPEQRKHETQSERYDRYAEDARKKRKRMGAPTGQTGDFYDYDTSADYGDDYDDADNYYGRDRGPADRTPEPIPPIYAKYLGTAGGEGSYYEEQYGKTAKKNNSVSLRRHRAQKRLKVLGITAACIAVVALAVYYFTMVHIYNPVRVENSIVNIQGADTTKMLQSVIGNRLSDKTIKVVVNGEPFLINLGEYGFNYSSDADGSEKEVTKQDLDGKDVKNTIVTYKNILYNQTKMEALLNSISDKYGTTMVKPSYTIDGDQLIITAGSDGVGVDENSLMGEILERIKKGNYDESLVEELVTTKAPDVNIDKIYKEVVCDVKDATSYVDENGTTIFNSDVVGKKFNLESARSAIESGGNTWSIKLKLTQPKVSLIELKAPYCPDLLAETTTSFSAENKTRAANIKNASKRINTYGSFEDGYILQPGEIFSYNDTVGERTEANGFSVATVYTNTGTTNDVGGGICQVSSAIFSAAFKADLEITQRTNHMYKVHYWTTPGEDATVNWGTLDFKFQNSKSYPVKIKMIYKNSNKKYDGKATITCQIWGTNDGYRCEFDNKTIKMVKTTVVEKKATTGKPRGKIEWGDPGLTVEIWRVRYKDDKKISKDLMWTSIYQPLATVKYV